MDLREVFFLFICYQVAAGGVLIFISFLMVIPHARRDGFDFGSIGIPPYYMMLSFPVYALAIVLLAGLRWFEIVTAPWSWQMYVAIAIAVGFITGYTGFRFPRIGEILYAWTNSKRSD